MREFNCDSLKGLPVPDELIEKALAVPDSCPSPAVHAAPIRLYRALAAAAAFVLTCTVSLTAFFLLKGAADPPVATLPASVSTSAQPTEYHSAAETQPYTLPTESPTADVTDNAASPTAYPTESGSEAQSSTQIRPTEANTEQPTQSPTQAPTQKPTQAPTQKPAQPTVPDDPPDGPTEEPLEPQVPDDPPVEEPVEHGEYLEYEPVPLRDFTGELYVRFTDSTGKLIGDPDLYSGYHLAEYDIWGQWLYVKYLREKAYGYLGADYKSVKYTYFYDSNGAVIGVGKISR